MWYSRANRKGMHKEMKKMNLKNQGDSIVKKIGNLVVTLWRDKKILLSSRQTPPRKISKSKESRKMVL